MKRISLLTFILLLAFQVNARSRESNGGRWGSIVETDTIQSKILNAPREFCVYLPAGYDLDTTRNYPILYLLHGLSDTNQAWFKKCPLAMEADRIIASGEAEPMIIVSPNAGGVPGKDWNGYFNMPGWAYETFFFDEFIPYIESAYRVKKGKDHRAISGLSMGGGGSTSYAQHHPDMFGSVYVMSGWLHSETDKNKEISKDDKMGLLNRAVAERSCVDFVKNADDATTDKLKSMEWFVDIGDDDFLLSQDIDFYKEMRRKGIPCQLRVRDGVHNWIYWQSALSNSLPFASRNFKP